MSRASEGLVLEQKEISEWIEDRYPTFPDYMARKAVKFLFFSILFYSILCCQPMWAWMRLLNNVNFCWDLWVTNSLTTALIQRNAGIIKDDFLNSSLNTTALGSHGYVLYSLSQIGLLGCLDVTSIHASTTYDSDPNVKTTEFNDPKTVRPRDIKGIVQRILKGVETRLKKSVQISHNTVNSPVFKLKRHHHNRSIKTVSAS